MAKQLTIQVRSEREHLTIQCYEALGWQETGRSKESDASPQTNLVLTRESPESPTDAAKRIRCEAVLQEIEAIDKKVERFYLERVVLVGMAGAACIGLSFLFLRLGWHVVFTLSLLAGLFGCSITLALRPPFTRLGLQKLGGEIPALEEKLCAILADEEG